jgi:hypothetical protein
MANDRRQSTDSTPEIRLTAGKQIGLRVPARMGAQLEAMARRENNGVSAVIRRLLTAALADDGHNEAA